jgi:transposase
MGVQRKYPLELRERATRLAIEARSDPTTRPGAYRRIGQQLGIHPEALRNWVNRAQAEQGSPMAPPSASLAVSEARVAELERENRELRRANQILRSAASFFAAELDRPSR